MGSITITELNMKSKIGISRVNADRKQVVAEEGRPFIKSGPKECVCRIIRACMAETNVLLRRTH